MFRQPTMAVPVQRSCNWRYTHLLFITPNPKAFEHKKACVIPLLIFHTSWHRYVCFYLHILDSLNLNAFPQVFYITCDFTLKTQCRCVSSLLCDLNSLAFKSLCILFVIQSAYILSNILFRLGKKAEVKYNWHYLKLTFFVFGDLAKILSEVKKPCTIAILKTIQTPSSLVTKDIP